MKKYDLSKQIKGISNFFVKDIYLLSHHSFLQFQLAHVNLELQSLLIHTKQTTFHIKSIVNFHVKPQ